MGRESLISNERKCYVCGWPYNLHKHHIFGGYGRRQTSEKYGCWVYLCERHHNMSDAGVHYSHKLDMRLKQECQEAWEAVYGGRGDFIDTFGKNYL